MQPYCFTEETSTNFGDDLNRWLWPRLLPEQMQQQDDILFCGIGTILGKGLPAAGHYVVFSSGAGYGPPTPGFGGDKWSIVCVRGPLTAQVLNLPPSKAAADGALLLASFPELKPLPEAERSGVVFMPHYENLPSGDWAEICRRAGVELLSPHLPSEEAVEKIRGSRLVLADAMHAAIVADAMRVPWVPLIASNRINTFKWLDWTLTLNLPYRPLTLPAPTLMEAVQDRGRVLTDDSFTLDDKTRASALGDFMRRRKLRDHRHWPSYRRLAVRVVRGVPNRVLRSRALSQAVEGNTAMRLDLTAAALQAAAKSTSYLSDDNVFFGKVDLLLSKLEEVKVLRA